jgi:phage shock protein A
MSVWGRLFTALKGSVNETAEAVADTQAVRILDQQMRDAESALARAQTDLAGLMGKAKLARDKMADLGQKHTRDMAVIERALEQGQEQLAAELAERIALLEGEIERESQATQLLTTKEAELRDTVTKIRQKISAMKREIDTVKVTESVQKAQEAIASHGAGAVSTLTNAASSLQRLKEKQAARAATFEATTKLEEIQSGSDLDRRLADAGLLSGPGSGASVLARLKSKQTAALPAPAVTVALPAPGTPVGSGGSSSS